MKTKNITPYIWTGEYDYYRKRYMASLWADYEGKEAFDINQSFSGEYTFPGDVSPTKIDISNAYRLQEQPGKQYALEMAHFIVHENMYVKSSFDGVNTHTMAQNRYLLGAASANVETVAMILEGAWWENEARDYFRTLASQYGSEYAFGTRRFGFMPAPKADESKVGEPMTMISSTGNSVVCMAAGVEGEALEIATAFLKYVHSDEALRTFTRMTGSIRPYDYEITDTDEREMSYFSRQMWALYHADDANICYVSLNNGITNDNYLGVGNVNFWWGSSVGGKLYTDPMYEFSQNSGLTAEQYFAGLRANFSEANWQRNMSQWING